MKADALNDANERLHAHLDDAKRLFGNPPGHRNARQAFEYDSRGMIGTSTGEEQLKLFFLRPGRNENDKRK